MKNQYKLSFLFIIQILIFSCVSLIAQMASPLNPKEPDTQRELGIVIGLGNNMQSGEFSSSSCVCKFDGGRKFGSTFGIVYEQDIKAPFKTGAYFLYDIKNITSSYKEIRNTRVTSSDLKLEQDMILPFRHEADLELGYLTFMPYLKWEWKSYFFARLGLSFSYNIRANIKHSEELLQKTGVMQTGDTTIIRLIGEDSYIRTIENGKFKNASSFQISIDPAIGLTLPLKERFLISPSVQYSLPLIATSSDATLKIHTLRFLVDVRFIVQFR
jgi:hypothetical protein